MNNFSNDKWILIDFNDTVASRICERDGVGEPGTPRGVSQARVARRIRVYTLKYTPLCLIYRSHVYARFDRFESARTSARSPRYTRRIYMDNWQYE